MQYDIVCVVASERGIPALRQLVAGLPSTFHAPIVCLAESREWLLEDLRRHTRMRVQWAKAGERLEKGTVYLSPPEASLVCTDPQRVTVAPYGPQSSALNPVDNFLTSVGSCFGHRALAVVLAGFARDGVAGAASLKAAGGALLVLDRATAAYWGVAEPMIRAGHFDRVLTIAEVAEALRGCFTSQDLLRCAEIQIELGGILEWALRVSGTSMGCMQRRERSSGALRVVAQRGLSREFIEHFDGMLPDAASVVGRAVLRRERVVIEDVLEDPALREIAMASGVRAVHATPAVLVPAAEVVGLVTTHFRQPHAVSVHEARDLDEIAAEAAGIFARFP